MVTITGNMIVTATFTKQHTFVTVTFVGAGCSVIKSPNQATYTYGSSVQLTPVPAAGWVFSGWSGSITGSANPTSLTIDGTKAVTATFTQILPAQYTLTVGTTGSGKVNFNPSGGIYAPNTPVTITATPNAGWTFAGWNGDVSGSSNPLSVIINKNTTLTATFTAIQYTLTVNVSPGSGGVITKSNNGPYHLNDVVTRTEAPNPGYTFAGWSGDGAGTGTTRTVTIMGNMAVTGSFTQNYYTLSLTSAGSGSGSVTINPSSGSYVYGTTVTLTANPTSGSFTSWGKTHRGFKSNNDHNGQQQGGNSHIQPDHLHPNSKRCRNWLFSYPESKPNKLHIRINGPIDTCSSSRLDILEVGWEPHRLI